MSRRRRDDWSPYGMPGIRRSYLRGVEKLADPDLWAGHPIAPVMTDMSATQARAARIADLYWATQDMARIALDASTDLPEIHLADVLPSRHGMMLFSEPLPPIPYNPIGIMPPDADQVMGQPVDTDGMLWRFEYNTVIVNALARAQRATDTMPVLGPLTDGATVVLPPERTRVVDLDQRQQRSVGAFLHSVMTLMTMPTVATMRDVEANTGSAQSRAAGDPIREGDVRLVDLRPMRYVRWEGEAQQRDRTYRHRWIVRGHWRQQAVGPKRGQRRTTWVPSYIKGPEGAPLMERETVMVWRR